MQHAFPPTLICYDGSSSSRHAITVLSETLATDKVVVLHCWERPLVALADSYSEPGTPVSHSVNGVEARETARATAVAAEGVELARSHGLNATMSVQRAEGEEWRVILTTADAMDAGLIVVGTRGRTALQDGLLGTSVSSDVLRHSLRPVLVVPALAGLDSPPSADGTVALAPATH